MELSKNFLVLFDRVVTCCLGLACRGKVNDPVRDGLSRLQVANKLRNPRLVAGRQRLDLFNDFLCAHAGKVALPTAESKLSIKRKAAKKLHATCRSAGLQTRSILEPANALRLGRPTLRGFRFKGIPSEMWPGFNALRKFGASEKSRGTLEQPALLQSQRDCVLQPRVARNELPWETGRRQTTPTAED